MNSVSLSKAGERTQKFNSNSRAVLMEAELVELESSTIFSRLFSSIFLM